MPLTLTVTPAALTAAEHAYLRTKATTFKAVMEAVLEAATPHLNEELVPAGRELDDDPRWEKALGLAAVIYGGTTGSIMSSPGTRKLFVELAVWFYTQLAAPPGDGAPGIRDEGTHR